MIEKIVHLLIFSLYLYFVAFAWRKMDADFESRVGPKRIGLAGFPQGIADVLKLFLKQKKKISPAERVGVFITAILFVLTLFLLPLSSKWIFADFDSALALSIFLLVGLILSLAARSFFPGDYAELMSAGRLGIQILSGLAPLWIAALAAGIHSSGYSWKGLVESQGFWPHQWRLFQEPFQFLLSLVFYLGGIVFIQMPPFASPYSTTDLRGGIHSQSAGKIHLLQRSVQHYLLIYWSILTVTIFYGGWSLPEWILGSVQDSAVHGIVELFVVLSKSAFLLFLVKWVSMVIPPLRLDQIVALCWKFLLPISLISLSGTIVWGVIVR